MFDESLFLGNDIKCTFSGCWQFSFIKIKPGLVKFHYFNWVDTLWTKLILKREYIKDETEWTERSVVVHSRRGNATQTEPKHLLAPQSHFSVCALVCVSSFVSEKERERHITSLCACVCVCVLDFIGPLLPPLGRSRPSAEWHMLLSVLMEGEEGQPNHSL